MQKRKLLKPAITISLAFLVITALLGVLLRFQFIESTLNNYGFTVHAHSHIGFLGWVFNMIIISISDRYFSSEQIKSVSYKLLFWSLQVCNTLLLLLFPFFGYTFPTIFISSIHVFLGYWFVIKVFRNAVFNHSIEKKHILTGLVFYLISSLGPYALAPLSIFGLKTTIWYKLTIYFYLHFQYNCLFLFIILGLFYKFINDSLLPIDEKHAQKGFLLNTAGAALSYCLSCLWIESPPVWLWLLSGLSALFLVTGFYFWWKSIPSIQQIISPHKKPVQLLFITFLLSIISKTIIQALSALPVFLNFSTQQFTIIGYLHLIFLGLVTCFFLFWLYTYQYLEVNKLTSVAIHSFLFSFVISELFLLTNSFVSLETTYFIGLFAVSCLFPISFIFLGTKKPSLK